MSVLLILPCSSSCIIFAADNFCFPSSLRSTGNGLYDVVGILIGSMTVEDRRAHCREILEAYQARLKELGVSYPWAQLWEDFKVNILQMTFLINYAFETSVDEAGNLKEDAPKLFFCFWERITSAIKEYDCCSAL